MKLTSMFLGILLLPFVGQDPPIRHVLQTVDSTFARRGTLCPNAPNLGGVSRRNDAQRSVAELLGSITAIDIHQFGQNFVDFVAVQAYLRQLLAQRPRGLSGGLNWANPTPLAGEGVLGTLHFATGSTGVFEAAHLHLCAQDSSGVYWWLRLAPLDLWPPE